MRHGLPLVLASLMVTGCNDTPATTEAKPTQSNSSSANQRDELVKKKLTIEQAAEEATKLIEGDAKAEIDAAMPTGAEPAQ